MAKLDLSKPVLFTIAAYLDSKRMRPVRPGPYRMRAPYDLSSVKIKTQLEYEKEQGISTGSKKAKYYASKSQVLSVKLFFNNVNLGSYYPSPAQDASLQNVDKQVALFKRLCEAVNGDSHEPSYLRLSWVQAGLDSTFDCRLQGFDLNFTSIAHDGTALLAELEATFLQSVDPKKQQARARLSSPDLTHRHLVLAGETLPMLCLRYYGSTDPFLQVAAFNQLDDFIVLEPGSQLYFPPLALQGEPV